MLVSSYLPYVVFGGDCNSKNWVMNLGESSPSKNGGQKRQKFRLHFGQSLDLIPNMSGLEQYIVDRKQHLVTAFTGKFIDAFIINGTPALGSFLA